MIARLQVLSERPESETRAGGKAKMDTGEKHRTASETQQDHDRDRNHEQEKEGAFADFRDYVPQEILNVSFPAAVRGYDRGAVDAYVQRVNRLIAEIKVTASPRAAVRHALRQTEEEVSGLLERARETADRVTTSALREAESEAEGIRAKAAELLVNANAEAEASKAEADRLLADSKAEAETLLGKAKADAEDILVRSRLEAENRAARGQADADERRAQLQTELASLRDQTEARMREFQADTSAVWAQRQQLLDQIRMTASGLTDLADAAAAQEPTEPDLLEALEAKARAETQPRGSEREAVESAAPAVGSEESTEGSESEGKR
jgi:DivIVA domain-containing protein